ncbi:MAG: FAD binding domain-containing protein [Ilumatobacteraceae bacterium]|nr:FAD binding domain-containing protein [Ilumatobacteraceae bacterium]
MPVVVPTSLADAVAAAAAAPEALFLAGGTDLMVEVNERHRTLPWGDTSVISLGRVPELTSWTLDPETRRLRLGAGIRWAEIERDPLQSMVPALAEAARTVGSPQIRNAGTIGGNLATCSPAGDGLPVLVALDAEIHLVASGGRRSMPVAEFMLGVKRTALEPGELIEAITVPVLDGWQGYSKVGVRNAMVIATASACVATDTPGRTVRIALGSVGPTIVRCHDAEQVVGEAVDWAGGTIDVAAADEAGRLAAAASRPIDDHRSTADYRRHAVGVMVRRLVRRAFPGGAA